MFSLVDLKICIVFTIIQLLKMNISHFVIFLIRSAFFRLMVGYVKVLPTPAYKICLNHCSTVPSAVRYCVKFYPGVIKIAEVKLL